MIRAAGEIRRRKGVIGSDSGGGGGGDAPRHGLMMIVIGIGAALRKEREEAVPSWFRGQVPEALREGLAARDAGPGQIRSGRRRSRLPDAPVTTQL